MNVDIAYLNWKTNPNDVSLKVLIDEMMHQAQAICRKRIPDLSQEHDDIISTSVSNCVLAIGDFAGGSQFSTWFHRSVSNEIANYFREQNPEEVSLEAQEIVIEPDLDKQLADRELLESFENLS